MPAIPQLLQIDLPATELEQDGEQVLVIRTLQGRRIIERFDTWAEAREHIEALREEEHGRTDESGQAGRD